MEERISDHTVTLHIDLSKTGIDRVRTQARTISDSIEIEKLKEASTLPLRLLDIAVSDYFNGKTAAMDTCAVEVAEEPVVWVRTNRDGEPDIPRKIKVRVGTLPRDPYEAPPSWFVAGMQKLFPEEDWVNAEAPLSKEELLALHSPEYIEKQKHLSVDELNELNTLPYCTRTEARAVSLFSNCCGCSSLLEHWGWIGQCGDDDRLILEPYIARMDDLKKLTALCDQIGWIHSNQGASGHHPSATTRIVISPRAKGYCYVR